MPIDHADDVGDLLAAVVDRLHRPSTTFAHDHRHRAPRRPKRRGRAGSLWLALSALRRTVELSLRPLAEAVSSSVLACSSVRWLQVGAIARSPISVRTGRDAVAALPHLRHGCGRRACSSCGRERRAVGPTPRRCRSKRRASVDAPAATASATCSASPSGRTIERVGEPAGQHCGEHRDHAGSDRARCAGRRSLQLPVRSLRAWPSVP